MREAHSKARCESPMQSLKQQLDIVSTDEGIQIARRKNIFGDWESARLTIDTRATRPLIFNSDF
jgi:hypothetical protein